MGLGRGDIGRFCCHPGGVKVIDAIETALELPPASSTSSAKCCATSAT
jgi:alkylresorcinol/alkylpyrone synthase